MRFLKRLGASLLRIAAGVPIVCLIGVGVVYVLFGATVVGRGVGLSGAMLGVALFCTVGYWRREWFRRIRGRFYLAILPAVFLIYAAAVIVGPGGGAAEGRVRNAYLGRRGNFCRWAPWNVVPEQDQIKVGLTLAAMGMPEIDSAEARRIWSLMGPLYDEMDRDADFRELGSEMGAACRDICRMKFGDGHYFVVLPRGSDAGRLSCLVFLHGMGGNVKPCLWVLGRLATEANCVVIAPTFGNGNWDRPEAAEFVVDVVREAIATLPIDRERVFLMGYSNGGMGVTRASVRAPSLFRGLIYLSPVTEDELFSTPEFVSRRADRKMLFLHGGKDKRIPRDVVEPTVARLGRLGYDVRLRMFEEEDHYLLLSQPEAVLGEIRELMGSR